MAFLSQRNRRSELLPVADRVCLAHGQVSSALRYSVLARLDVARNRHLGLVIRDFHLLELDRAEVLMAEIHHQAVIRTEHRLDQSLRVELVLKLLLQSRLLDLALELLLHLELGLRDLLGDIVVRLGLILGHDLEFQLLAILNLLHRHLVLGLVQFELFLKTLLLLGLLANARLGDPELMGHLFLFGDSAELEVATLAETEKMLWKVVVHLHQLRFRLTEHIAVRNVVRIEDFVFAARKSGNREDQPVLVREVLLFHINSALDVQLFQVGLKLFDQDELCRGSHAYAENNLLLLDRDDLEVLHRSDHVLVDELAREGREEVAFPNCRFPICLHIFVNDRAGSVS